MARILCTRADGTNLVYNEVLASEGTLYFLSYIHKDTINQ